MSVFSKLALLVVVLSSAFVLSACNVYNKNNNTSSETSQQQSNSSAAALDEVTVTFIDGSSPSEVKVKSGGKINWVNNSSVKVQVGSDPHPTHTTNTEITGGQFVIELDPGATATVNVSRTGTWGYHDHLNPALRGKVIVE